MPPGPTCLNSLFFLEFSISYLELILYGNNNNTGGNKMVGRRTQPI